MQITCTRYQPINRSGETTLFSRTGAARLFSPIKPTSVNYGVLLKVCYFTKPKWLEHVKVHNIYIITYIIYVYSKRDPSESYFMVFDYRKTRRGIELEITVRYSFGMFIQGVRSEFIRSDISSRQWLPGSVHVFRFDSEKQKIYITIRTIRSQ